MNIEKEIIECKIDLLKSPKEIQEALVPIEKLLTEKMVTECDWDYTTGNLPKPDFPKPLDIYFELWGLQQDVNEIFENINAIFYELKLIRDDTKAFFKNYDFDPVIKYKLLTRTFFYEFFRIKENFSFFLSRLKKMGLLQSQDVKEIKSDFYKVFETAIKVRNDMVHNRYLWPGKGHLHLNLVLSAEAVGRALIDKESGNIINKTDLLSDLSCEALKTFMLESLTIKSFFIRFFESVVGVIRNRESF